jgi:quinoprotein relay system zinc metallohydrolase 2
MLIGGVCFLSVARAAGFRLEEVGQGIYVRRGLDEEATPGNANAIANLACVIGKNAVAVMDPGGGVEDGRHFQESIRKITKLPIRYVILSHAHPDHVFGASAFANDKPIFVGHARLPSVLAARGDYYRKRLDQELGESRAGPVVQPTMLVNDRAEIDLGQRKLVLTAHATGHSDCDVTGFDAQTATLLAGDTLFVKRTPSLDGSLLGWLQQLEGLKTVPAKRAVPGHGPVQVDWPAGAADLERYLNTLLRETRAAIAKGLEITEAVEAVGHSERGKWLLFAEYHGGNVTKAFKELEWE